MLQKFHIKAIRHSTRRGFRYFVVLFLTVILNSISNLSFAQVTTLQNWTNLYNNSTSNSLSLTYTVPAGTNTNRLLVVAVATSSTTTTARTITPITYGGRNLTAQISDLSSSTQQHTVLYYLKESDLDLAANTNLAITINTGTTRVNTVWAVVFDNVDQINTIADSKNYNSGTTAVSSGQFATALSIPANAQPVMVFSSFRVGNTNARTISTFPANWTRVSEVTFASTDGVRNLVASKTINATSTNDACAFTLSGNALVSMSAMSINGCVAPTVNAGAALSAICKGGTSAALGGSVGGSASTGTWTDGGVGGSFSPNANTLNATYTPPAIFTGTITLTLTTTNGQCANVSANKTLVVNAPPSASINYSNTSYCNSVLTAQNCTVTGTTGGSFSASPTGLSINSSTGAIVPSSSSTGDYTVTYTIAASGGCSIYSTSTTVTIVNDQNTINYPALSYCSSNTSTINVTRNAPSGGSYSASPAGLTIDASTGTVNLATSIAGSYTITYTYSGNTCSSTASTTLNLIATPTVSCPANLAVCLAAAPFSLSGGSPLGGTYSGPGVSAGNFNPATAGIGTHTISYTYTNASGCSSSCNYSITVVASAPTITATAVNTNVYTGNYATINMNSTVTGTQYTWTVTSNNPVITGYSDQSSPSTGPINQQLFNSSPNIGQVTYLISPSIIGCTGTPVTVVISMPSATFCENPGTFQTGSCIIDMGVTPQTYANGLKPYGLVYQLLNIYNIPVYWAVNPNKSFVNPIAKVDQADFTVDGYTYKGGSFIIPAGFLATVQSVINSWAAQGVVVRYSTTSFDPPYYELLTRIPKVVLDINTGDLIESGFYTKAGIPTTAYTKGGIPSAITNCDDIYVLPHADPASWTQAQKDSLLNFINQRGWLFTSCYAVSQIENLPGMNFLSNAGLLTYNSHVHPPTGGAFGYSLGAGIDAASFASDPFMQFVGKFDGAVNTYALERVYVPKAQGWRSSTKIASYFPNYVNNGITYSNTAAELAYGRAFGDNNKGIVMYLAGHDFERGSTVEENVAMARVYASFLLRSGIGTRPIINPVSIPNTATSGQTITLQVSVPPSTSTIVSYQWISDLNGIFSSPQSVTTNFTAPTVDVPTLCTVQFKVIDACGRSGLFCTTILINPTITNNYISNAQTICQGNIPASFTGTVAIAPGGAAVTYLWLMSTTSSSVGFTSAPGINNQQNYTAPALNQTTWIRRQVTANGITVFSTPIEITVNQGPPITTQPSTATQGVCQGGSLDPINVSSNIAGVSYQWYSNTSASTSGGTLIAGATSSTYTPLSNAAGTLYYYCQISGASGCPSVSNVSGAISVISGLIITTNPSTANQSICVGDPITPLSIVANGSGLQYQWYYNAASSNGTGSVLISGATTSTYTPSIVGSYYYHVRVFSPSCGSLLKSNPSGLITVKVLPTPGITNNSGTTNITCGTRSISLTGTGGSSYIWSSGLGNSATASVTTPGTYTVTVTGSNGCNASTNIIITSTISGSTWTGEYDAEWEHAENWCGGVPTDTSDVMIPAGMLNDPVIDDTIAMVRNITIANGAVLYLDGETLQIFGSVSSNANINSVNGSIELKGNTPQTIAGHMFAAHRVHDLKISNSAGVTLAGTNDTLRLTGNLEFGSSNVTLNSNGNLTIASDINGTGRVGDLTANGIFSGNKILGNVTVERYIPNHTKAWQLLAVPTTGQTIKAAWQEGNTPLSNALNPGYGTIITSHLAGATTTLGFDIYTPAGSTMKTFSPADSSWIGVPSTTSPIANARGYMILVRGDRSVTAYNQAATATTMRTTGVLYQTELNVPAVTNVMGNRYECIGNPYASAVDVSKLTRTGGVQDVYYVWDPKLTNSPYSVWGLGAFQTIVRSGSGYTIVPGGGSYVGNNGRIESGQAFLVRAYGSDGTVSFTESAKTAGSNLVTRNTTQPMSFRMNLSVLNNGDAILLDGTLLNIDATFSNAVNQEDAVKIAYGNNESISILNAGIKLVAEQRNLPIRTDTVYYNLGSLKRQTYQLDIIAERMSNAGLTAKLVDRYLGTITDIDLRGENMVAFTVTADPLSYASDRFYIIFNKARTPRSTSVLTLSNRQTSQKPESDKNIESSSFEVYPNPVINRVAQLHIKNIEKGIHEINIYDHTGRRVMGNKISVLTIQEIHSINIDNNLPAGVYQFVLTDALSHQSHRKKVIIK